eukprot:2909457-Amphidinium_carterae.2
MATEPKWLRKIGGANLCPSVSYEPSIGHSLETRIVSHECLCERSMSQVCMSSDRSFCGCNGTSRHNCQG